MLSLLVLQKIAYFYEAVLAKQEYRQKKNLVEAIHNYAISFCKINFDKLIKEKNDFYIILQDLNLNNKKITPIIKIFSYKDKELYIESKLVSKDTNIVIKIESIIEKIGSKEFCINNWKLNGF